MKRLFTRIALLAIFAGAFMSSCTEDEYSMENGSEIEYSYKTTMSPVNRLNPNDSIGVLHNIHLDSIISLLCDNYADANAIHPDTLHQFVENYFLNIYDRDIIKEVFKDTDNTLNDNQSIDSVLTELKFSEDAKEIVFSLLKTIEGMENKGYSPYYEVICKVEEDILSNQSFTTTEEQILLSFTSVLRHSLYYWYEPISLAKSTPDWASIALADARGAIKGAKAGLRVGSAVGHPAVGTAVGAVAGAALKSAKKAHKTNKIKR